MPTDGASNGRAPSRSIIPVQNPGEGHLHCGNWEVTILEHGSKEDVGGTCYKSLRNGHIHHGHPGGLPRIARFVGAEEPV